MFCDKCGDKMDLIYETPMFMIITNYFDERLSHIYRCKICKVRTRVIT